MIEVQDRASQAGNAGRNEVSVGGSQSLDQREIDWCSSLASLNFNGIKAIATQLVDECAGPEEFSDEAIAVYLSLRSSIDEQNLTQAEKLELMNLLEQGGFSVERQLIRSRGMDRDDKAMTGVTKLLSEFAHRDSTPTDARIEACVALLMGAPGEIQENALKKLLSLIKAEDASVSKRYETAMLLHEYGSMSNNLHISEEAGKVLLELMSKDKDTFQESIKMFTESMTHGRRNEALVKLLLGATQLEGVTTDAKINILETILKHGTSEDQVRAKASLATIAQEEGLSVDEQLKIVSAISKHAKAASNPEAKKRASDTLLTFAQLTSLSVDHRIALIEVVFDQGSLEDGERAEALLMEMAKQEGLSVGEQLKFIREILINAITPEVMDQALEHLLKAEQREGVTTHERIHILEALLAYGTPEIRKETVATFLAIAQQDGLTAREQMDIVRAIQDYTTEVRVMGRNSPELKRQALDTLLTFAQLTWMTLDNRITFMQNVLQYGTPEAQEKASDELLRLTQLKEGVTTDEKINLLRAVLLSGNSEAKAQASQLFLTLLDRVIETQGSMDIHEKKLVANRLLNLASTLPIGEIKEKILFYFVHHVLRDASFAEDRDTLLAVSGAVTNGLQGFEDDERFQIALSVQLQLQDPDAQNAFTIYQSGQMKRESLREVDLDSIQLPTVNGEEGARYTLVGSSIQQTLPIPAPAAMPHATYDEFVQLGNHLREAVQHCSKEQKAMLLGIDADAYSEDAINAKMANNINGLLTAVMQSNEIAAWMTPHREGGFNRTKYELQAVVRHAHDLLTSWKDAGGAHGAELSPAAATFFQLLVNITSCPSGKAAGVHTAFIEVPGVHSPISEDALIAPLPEELKTFLESREEANIQVRPKVLAFIEDANDLYHTFRMELLNGDGPFLQSITGKDRQPSHQRDYAYLVLSEALGLSLKGEAIPVDLHGQLVNTALRDRDATALLNAYFGTVFEGGRNFTEALVDKFHAHWSAKIEAGLNNPNASKEEKEAYNDFVSALSAAGINTNTCLDTDYDDEDNEIYTFKKSAVPGILCALGMLKAM